MFRKSDKKGKCLTCDRVSVRRWRENDKKLICGILFEGINYQDFQYIVASGGG